jgi:hypothetical protein
MSNEKTHYPVHIIEPRWNDLVIEQIIGRAVRKQNHPILQKKDHDVKVSTYIKIDFNTLIKK